MYIYIYIYIHVPLDLFLVAFTGALWLTSGSPSGNLPVSSGLPCFPHRGNGGGNGGPKWRRKMVAGNGGIQNPQPWPIGHKRRHSFQKTSRKLPGNETVDRRCRRYDLKTLLPRTTFVPRQGHASYPSRRGGHIRTHIRPTGD